MAVAIGVMVVVVIIRILVSALARKMGGNILLAVQHVLAEHLPVLPLRMGP